MSEFSFSSNTIKKPKQDHFSSLLLSDLFLFCSFILSHPLYFLYFIFFSPYLLKLLTFLSPLFITTSLLLLTLFTLSPTLAHDNVRSEFSEDSKVSFLLSSCRSLRGKILASKIDDENEDFQCFEELEAYKIVFEASTLEITQNSDGILDLESKENCLAIYEPQVDKHCLNHEDVGVIFSEASVGNLDENPVGDTQQIDGGVRLQELLVEKRELEEGQREVNPLSEESNKGEDQKEGEEEEKFKGSKAIGNKIIEAKVSSDNTKELISKTKLSSRSLRANFGSCNYEEAEYNYKFTENSPRMESNLGSFGSMRKEKEWRRTLACKLFEERHNVEGSEGMDLLWEAYETDSNTKAKPKRKTKKGKEEEEEEDYEEDGDGQLCCLQALKFSAGKMNLGMGRPNLVKISKALKGFGWLHNVTRHAKKSQR